MLMSTNLLCTSIGKQFFLEVEKVNNLLAQLFFYVFSIFLSLEV